MSIEHSKLPLLPGFSFDKTVGKSYFGRRQYFCLNGDICTLNSDPVRTYRPSIFLNSSDVPPWLLFDKQILTFDAIFQNDLNQPIRLVKILYFLEDGTMKVVEPKTNNSGLNQGTIIGRQRIPIGESDLNFIEAIDLNVGKEIELYKKNFLLIHCDAFTRSFLTKIGIRVPESSEIPKNNQSTIKEIQKNRQSLSSKQTKSSVQFLEFDRKILRFYGYWDEDGDIHKLELLYYLADDTIEIHEIALNKGKNHVFLRRGALPKKLQKCLVANFRLPVEVYTPSDLLIGAKIDVYGRMIHLTDCDPFTKEYYLSKYGIEHFERIPIPDNYADKPFQYTHTRELPPWNGLGSFEDSAGNCNSLLPKATRCNFDKFLNKDRIGNNSHILRFMARLISDISDDAMRKFVISYYLWDDTISVFEEKVRNSGFRGGMIFKRNSVTLPGQDLYVNHSPVHYTHRDMWIGNKLIINDHSFLLVNADEYTLKYMEQFSEDFEKSNIVVIMNKIRQKLLSLENGYKDFVARNMDGANSANDNLMPVLLFESALKKVASDILTEHEFITITRYFRQIDPPVTLNREQIRSIVYSHLSRNLWQDNDRLLEHFKYLDEKCSGYLSSKDVRYALIANRIPIPCDILNEMLNLISINHNNELNYNDVIEFLNFKLKPAQELLALPSKSTKKIQTFLPENVIPERPIDDIMIKWSEFIKELNLEYLLTENP